MKKHYKLKAMICLLFIFCLLTVDCLARPSFSSYDFSCCGSVMKYVYSYESGNWAYANVSQHKKAWTGIYSCQVNPSHATKTKIAYEYASHDWHFVSNHYWMTGVRKDSTMRCPTCSTTIKLLYDESGKPYSYIFQ